MRVGDVDGRESLSLFHPFHYDRSGTRDGGMFACGGGFCVWSFIACVLVSLTFLLLPSYTVS